MQRPPLTPIFILGIMPRSGTNYLNSLLLLHPETASRPGIPEDFLLAQAHHLRQYRDGVFGSWPLIWGTPPAAEGASLLRHIGDGLIHWLADPVPGRRVVTKTPSVANLDLLPLLFPDACALIVIRDGRSVVESGVRSFDWSYPAAMRQWSNAARQVMLFDRQYHDSGYRYRILRYEDLFSPTDDQVIDLLALCQLDPRRFDLDAARKLPVRGSSEARRTGELRMHWQPVDRIAGFDPTRRFSQWDAYRHRQFAAIAGEAQCALGYSLETPSSPSVRLRARNRIQDTKRKMGRRSLLTYTRDRVMSAACRRACRSAVPASLSLRNSALAATDASTQE